jgi:hypothetical protein
VNPSEISERPEAPPLEVSPSELAVLVESSPGVVASNPSSQPFLSWLRLAYAFEFLIAPIAIISMWSEIGGEGHLDLMPWYVKLICIMGLDWCVVRFTAALVEQPRVWTSRSVRWLLGILLFGLLMGAITYYYHLHEESDDDGDEDTTAAAMTIYNPGTFFDHGSTRANPAFRVRLVARSRLFETYRMPAGSNG